MGTIPIKFKSKVITLHSARVQPKFDAQTVLCDSPWEYVKLRLLQEGNKNAQFYWEQARHFYKATQLLPYEASPLTSYYSILNATKALLEKFNQTSYAEQHGVVGSKISNRTSLSNEQVTIQTSGVLGALTRFLGYTLHENKNYDLKCVFYNMPFIHRAYLLTFTSSTNQFVPITESHFVRKEQSYEAWFEATVHQRYTKNLESVLPDQFERCKNVKTSFVIREKKRFKWFHGNQNKSIKNLTSYHNKIRKHFFPIFSPENRWYLKKNSASNNHIDLPQLVLIYSALHRISELSRYDPIRLSKHFNTQHNWLLTEFLRLAPAQFIHRIAAEMTGNEFLVPDTFGIDSDSV